MDFSLKQQLDKFGLAELVDFVFDNIGISSLDDINNFDFNEPEYIEELDKLSSSDKNTLLLFLKTVQTANKVRNVSNYQSSLYT